MVSVEEVTTLPPHHEEFEAEVRGPEAGSDH